MSDSREFIKMRKRALQYHQDKRSKSTVRLKPKMDFSNKKNSRDTVSVGKKSQGDVKVENFQYQKDHFEPLKIVSDTSTRYLMFFKSMANRNNKLDQEKL